MLLMRDVGSVLRFPSGTAAVLSDHVRTSDYETKDPLGIELTYTVAVPVVVVRVVLEVLVVDTTTVTVGAAT
jgi:hypothetical protein